MSEVYFIDARNGVPFVEKLETLLEKVGEGPGSNLKGNIALKMHMGERNNETFIKPFYVQKIAEIVKKQGGDPFVTDTTTLYKFDRYRSMDYYRTAFEHGFLPSYLGCPVIIADGLKDDGVEVSERVEIARGIYEGDGMVVVSHATGHGTASFGGAIKNVAMGCVTKEVIEGLCCIKENFEPRIIPPAYHTNLLDAYDSLAWLKEIADYVIPMHETF